MTTIVTTHSSEYATMYADEGITGDYIHPDMNKIVHQGTWLVAVCGEDRICDVLQYLVKYPTPPQYLINKPYDEWLKWMVSRVIPEIAKAVEKSLHKSYKNSIGESDLLLITHGKAFLISETLGVSKAHPYWSIGSGSPIALGYLAGNSYEPDWDSLHSAYARRAIETAQMHDPYTRGKIKGYASYKDGSVKEL